MVRDKWRLLDEQTRLVYVMMSRAHRERAIYVNKLSQIKESLLREHPALLQTITDQQQFAQQAFDKISAQIDAENDESCSVNESPRSSSDEADFACEVASSPVKEKGGSASKVFDYNGK